MILLSEVQHDPPWSATLVGRFGNRIQEAWHTFGANGPTCSIYNLIYLVCSTVPTLCQCWLGLELGVDTSDINNCFFCWHACSPLTWSRIGSSLSSASCNKYKSLVLNFLQWEFTFESALIRPWWPHKRRQLKVEDLLSVKSFLQQKNQSQAYICMHSV